MIVKIKEVDYKLRFGFDFIDYLDTIFYAEVGGVKYGMGLTMLLTGLADENPSTLIDVIKAGTSTEDQKPSTVDIKDYITQLAEQNEEGLNPIFEEYSEEIKKQPLLKGKVKKFLANMNDNKAEE